MSTSKLDAVVVVLHDPDDIKSKLDDLLRRRTSGLLKHLVSKVPAQAIALRKTSRTAMKRACGYTYRNALYNSPIPNFDSLDVTFDDVLQMILNNIPLTEIVDAARRFGELGCIMHVVKAESAFTLDPNRLIKAPTTQ